MTNVTLEIRVVPGDEEPSSDQVMKRKFQLDKKDLENVSSISTFNIQLYFPIQSKILILFYYLKYA